VAVGVPGMYLAGYGLEYSGAAVVYRQGEASAQHA
jgi:hypothetical protein